MENSPANPVFRLHDELLEEIFLLGCTNQAPCPSYEAFRVPWVYVQICRRWRQVALAYGQLWRHLRLVIRDESDCTHRDVQAISLMLERSNGLPLSLEICNSGQTPCSTTWRTLMDAKHRWESVQLNTLDVASLPGRFTSWQKLVGVHLDFRGSWYSSSPVSLDLTTLSALKHYTEWTSRHCGLSVILPLMTLERLEIHMAHHPTHCLLGYAPRLRQLYIDNRSFEPLSINAFHLPTQERATSLFPQLKELHLGNSQCVTFHARDSPLSNLFVYISTRSAALHSDTFVMDHLADILAASADTLVSLDVRGDIEWANERFQRQISGLTHLHSLRIGVSMSLRPWTKSSDYATRLWDRFIRLLCGMTCLSRTKIILICRVFGAAWERDDVEDVLRDSELGPQLLAMLAQIPSRDTTLEVDFDVVGADCLRKTFEVLRNGEIVEKK